MVSLEHIHARLQQFFKLGYLPKDIYVCIRASDIEELVQLQQRTCISDEDVKYKVGDMGTVSGCPFEVVDDSQPSTLQLVKYGEADSVSYKIVLKEDRLW